MPEVNIRVKNKIAISPEEHIVCGNKDYQIVFEFDSEWNSHETKTARFVWNGNREDVVFSGNRCNAPAIRGATVCAVGVFAGDLCTTTPALVSCIKSILCADGLPVEPSPDVYAQIMERMNELEESVKENPSGGGVDFETDATLKLENGILSVNTTDQMEQDNTLPITSAGVFATVGNIEAMLKTI